MPAAVSIAQTRSPGSRCSRSAISFGRVALTEPPACRSFNSLVTFCLGVKRSTFVLRHVSSSPRLKRGAREIPPLRGSISEVKVRLPEADAADVDVDELIWIVTDSAEFH